ncbi:MAG TPA: hypothetical protein PK233_08100, partial [Candidatus Atribacteria bacterium]|nr:hypothetical protein [Candidatus Atribacteria bacterium]
QSFTGLFRTKLSFASFYYKLLVLELKVLRKLASGMLQIHIAKYNPRRRERLLLFCHRLFGDMLIVSEYIRKKFWSVY